MKTPQPWIKYRTSAALSGNAPFPLDDAFDGLKHPHVCDRPSQGMPIPYATEEEQLAGQWFNDTVAVYVLNLRNYTQRWEMISRRLRELNIKAERVFGVDMQDVSYLHDGFVVRLWRLISQELPCDWDIVQLLGRCPYGECISQHLARVQPDANEPKWRCRAGVNLGMHATLYRPERLSAVQERWKRAVFNEHQPHCLDIDVGLASISDEVGYYSVPASQTPGLLKEMDLDSARSDFNDGGAPQPWKSN